MDMSRLVPHSDNLHIKSLIHKGTLCGGDIWQSTSDRCQSGHVARITQIQSDPGTGRLILWTPKQGQVLASRPLFVRLHYRSLIFCLLPGEFSVAGEQILCDYPKEVKALEERSGGDRYVLPFLAEISLSLKRVERSMRELTYEMELRIIDVSQKGFGIHISGPNRDYLRKNDRFWLRAIDHQPLRSPIAGTVCYVAPRWPDLKRGDVRVGLSLAGALGKDALEKLKKKSIHVLPA